ncbi:MAG: hypothetical protein N3B17_00335 [Chlorobi bacterium]|nr:hypothetical protein [Chlorobiota bacterium]
MARLVLVLFAIATIVTGFGLYGLGFVRRLSGRKRVSVRRHPPIVPEKVGTARTMQRP